ncbi:TonB-dependent receptor [Silvibacterium dinghuense]|uniref:TonB-dependent receptor n=1 Tax=Silvibacterium dinghuense TaxID=1560006 RepID=UPI0013E974B2|nr:TonB-dependent receptor [Silvibacterium dinghuense]
MILALLLIAGAGMVRAQVLTEGHSQVRAAEGSVSGVIVDPTGALVAGAQVVLTGPDGASLLGRSDAEGTFRFEALASGAYSLHIVTKGFQAEDRTGLQVEDGVSLRLRLSLKIEIQRQDIAVSGEELDATPERSQQALVLTRRDLASLPTNPGDLKTLLQAMSGSGSPMNMQVDGFTMSRLPPKAAIREIRLNQNPYSAQYDSTGENHVEVFTQAGGDKLHGDLDLLGEDSAFDTKNPFVVEQPEYAAFYASGDLSGPLTRSSSWFLAADRQDVGAQSYVYATTSSTGPVYQTALSSPFTSTDAGPRIDFQIGKHQQITMRYQFGRQAQDNLLDSQLSLPSMAFSTRHTEQALQLADMQTWGPHTVNETRFQFQRTNDSTVPVSAASEVVVEGAFNGGGNSNGQLHEGQNRYELQDYASHELGRHLLRLGGRLRDVDDDSTSTAGYNGQFLFDSIEAYEITEQGLAAGLTMAEIRTLGGGASQFSYALGTPRLRVNVADLGLYAEDEWRIRSNQTLDLGLRYEMQSGIPDHADWAPRGSWSWGIGANRGPDHDKPAWAVLRLGAGIFYGRFDPKYILIAGRENGIRQQRWVVNDPDFYPSVPAPADFGPGAQPTIYRISSRLHAPYVVQRGVSVDKTFDKRWTVSADWSWFKGFDQLLTRNVNAPLPGTYNPDDPTSGTRPMGGNENIYEYESEANSTRNRLFVNVHYRTSWATLYGNYSYGHARADTAGPGSFPSNQYDLRQDWGRAANDIRHRLYVGALANTPGKFELNPFLVFESSMPFNITTGTDLNGDSQYNDRPAFATDLSRPSVYRTKWGNFDADPLPGQNVIPINYGTGPAVVMLNFSASRDFAFGPVTPGEGGAPGARKYQMNLGFEGQNILNIVNGGPPEGVLSAPEFGHSTALVTTVYSSNQANRIMYLHVALNF